ncbi:hypothetical protein BR93DRAFT_738934 [Coniochaeta sp. PMI_546]|nr:hypothetical protein BR93DRAFT_738934 [Coniochaeta sp. PMI_546]
MRLINTTTLELEEFQGLVPAYAILSHTWGSEEVSLQEWREAHKLGNIMNLYSSLSRTNPNIRPPGEVLPSAPRIAPIGHNATWPAHGNLTDPKPTPFGFYKILRASLRARLDGLDYLWVDTSCIDKTSSAELSEAINSMYAWYRNSTVCYAYLTDVPVGLTPSQLSSTASPFRTSRWFKRGWTLQELLAPKKVIFFASDWSELGRKDGLSDLISEITRIDTRYLLRVRHISGASIAHRLSWVSDRTTTRPEDIAYCLLGIFDVHMPLIYGEGSRAFVRLQEEIIKISEDHSIFAWTWVAELSGPLMRGNRRDLVTAARMREVIESGRKGEGFPRCRLEALMADSLWQDPLRSTLLAPDPICFYDAGEFKKLLMPGREVRPFVMTNAGLMLELPLIRHLEGGLVFAVLHEEVDEKKKRSEVVCVPLVRHHEHRHRYTRTWFPPGPVRIVREGRLGVKARELSVVRDVQHARFYYPGFGGAGKKFGFWLVVSGEWDGWTVAGGYAARDGVFNSYGVFFDIAEEDQGCPVGGLLAFDAPDRKPFVVVVFLAISLMRDKAKDDDHVEVKRHCEVMVRPRSQVQQQRGLEDLYRTLSGKHRSSPSTRTARAGDCHIWIRNEWPVSHAEDARIATTEIMFSNGIS